MFGLPEIATLTSEVVLSLYPILIKVVDTTLPTQILARLFTFTVLSAVCLSSTLWGDFSVLGFFALGLLNLVHIGSSYVAFHDLPAGPAMALFYTYPFLNLLFSRLLLGIPIHLAAFGWMALAFGGSLLLIHSMNEEETESSSSKKEEGFAVFGLSSSKRRGVAAALLAAATEALIYVATLHAGAPFATLFQLYGGALLLLGVGMGMSGTAFSYVSPRTAAFLLGFNSLLGFLGNALRFWSIPRLSVALFSILSFVGVGSAYLFGIRFIGEIPSGISLLGGGLIAGAIVGMHVSS